MFINKNNIFLLGFLPHAELVEYDSVKVLKRSIYNNEIKKLIFYY